MNILFLSTHFNTGGITSYIFSLAKGLKEKGHQVYVASSGGNMQADLLYAGIEHLSLDIKTKSELDTRLYTSLGKLCRFIKQREIDLIHAQTRVTQVMGTLASRKVSRPYVSTCHGFFKPRLSRLIFPCWGKGVIAISEQVKAHLVQDLSVPENRISVISNGIDINQFGMEDKKSRKKKRKRFYLDEEPVVGIIARLSDVKGHVFLIRAMKNVVEEFPDAKLLIIGEGREEPSLKNLVKELGLGGQVSFHAVVNQTKDILPAFDVFAMPSLQEGLGISILEAQACGLPVVASRVGGIPSLIDHGETGLLVEPADIEGLSSALIKVLQDKEYAFRLGRQARESVKKHFSIEQMVEQTEAFYAKAMS